MKEFPLRVVTHEDDKWIKGYHLHEDGTKIPWIKISDKQWENSFWFLRNIDDLFHEFNWCGIDQQRQKEFKDFVGLWYINSFYYLNGVVGNNKNSFKPIFNLLMGPIAEYLNEIGENASSLSKLLPAHKFKEFYMLTQKEGFIKSKSKDAIRLLLQKRNLKLIEDNKNFWSSDELELDNLITQISQEQKEKILLGQQDKIGNWLVGQVLKALKGQGDPVLIKEKSFKIVENMFK